MDTFFEKHKRPHTSILEEWWDEIEAMRTQEWPYRRIADWLRNNKEITISAEAVRQFCKVRDISKGNSERQPKARPSRTPTKPLKQNRYPKPKTPVKRIFEYDDTEPIDIHNKKSAKSGF